ncbi:4432_t:CDS:1, partial [Ambispora leptoticha]
DEKFDKLIAWIRQVDIGFQYAHVQGIMHRDDNIIIDSTDRVRIIDWGISFRRGESNQKSFMGKPLFALLCILLLYPSQSNVSYEYEEKDDFESLFYMLIGKVIAQKLPWDWTSTMFITSNTCICIFGAGNDGYYTF